MKVFFAALLAIAIYTCNKVDEKDKATFIKVCRYNCDSSLYCKTYFFTKADSLTIDSLSKGIEPNAKSYVSVEPDQHQLQYLVKDTIVFYLK